MSAKEMKSEKRFERCLEMLFDIEGGYSDDADDPGGETMWGISRRYHPEMWTDGPPSRGDASGFYRREYWVPSGAVLLENERMAWQVFESAVHFNPRASGRFLQRAFNRLVRGWRPRLVEDGVVGPKTAGSVNAWCKRRGNYANALYRAANYLQASFYWRTRNDKFLVGWFGMRLD